MRRFVTTLLAVAVLATASCGASGKASPNAVGTGGVRTTAPGATKGSTGSQSSTAGGTTSGGSTASAQPGKPGASGTATPSYPSARTTDGSIHPSHVATEKELPITATVSPSCVMPGLTATLRVTTEPEAGIAFVAVYNGEKSGAAPPWGEGYGGNDKGEADGKGNYSTTWTVAANTPSGPARVILVVGSKKYGKQRTVNVPFSVGEREVGGCGT